MNSRQRRAERRATGRRDLADPRQVEDRREVARRRDPPLDGQTLDDRLRQLGIGQDRRRAPGDRRYGGERRHR